MVDVPGDGVSVYLNRIKVKNACLEDSRTIIYRCVARERIRASREPAGQQKQENNPGRGKRARREIRLVDDRFLSTLH